MKPAVFASLAALTGLLLTGCQTAGGGASPELKSAQSAALARQKALEKSLAGHLAAQSALSNQADRIHADLLDAAKEMRTIKDEANRLSSATHTNQLALQSLEKEIIAHRTQIEELEKKALEESEKVKALQDALSKEQQVRQQQQEALKAEAARQAVEDQKKADELRKALAREQELRGKDQTALQSREKEIADLRKALEEKDRSLRAQAAQPPPPAPAGAPAAQNPAFKQVADGNAALRQGKIDEAEKLFKDALIATPGLVGARIGLAACRYERGDLAQAGEIASAVLKEDRRNAQALGLMGLVHWRKGELADAEDVLGSAVKQDKTDSQLRNYLGIVLYERKKSDAAIESLRKAVELDSGNAEARYNLAVVLAMSPKPQLDEARVQYEKAVQLGSARDEAMEKILAPAAAPAAKP